MDISKHQLSRRGLIGLGAAGLAGAALAACSASPSRVAPSASYSADTPLKFWDMQWSGAAYDTESAALATAFRRAKVTKTAVPWTNYVANITTAVSSGTGPDVGSGGSFLPASFYPQGAIQPVTGLVKKLKASGAYDDFVDGSFATLTMDGKQIAVPWNIDVRCLNYRPSVLKAAGVEELPTDWNGFLDAGKKLKKKGVALLQMVGSATGNSTWQQILPFMLNNGGGWFDKSGHPDVVTDRNEEAIEFLLQISKDGMLNDGALSLTKDDVNTLWANGKTAFAMMNPVYSVTFADNPAVESDTVVASPLAGPHGDHGTVSWMNGLMIYSAAKEIEAAEDFLVYYLDKMSVYWKKNLLTVLPVRKSIAALPEFKANKNAARALKEWVPIGRPQTTFDKNQLAQVATLSGSPVTITFAQEVVAATKSAKAILKEFQSGLDKAFGS